MSDVARYLPTAVACVASAWLLGIGCSWDYALDARVVDSDVDASDAAVDTDDGGPFADAEHTLPDGRVCRGHDEDRDGIPDDCDNCPNVPNPEQTGGKVGTACAPGTSFISAPERLLFDPFTSFGSWKSFGTGVGLFQVAADNDSFTGGSAVGDELRFATTSPGAPSSAIVVTTTMTVIDDAKTGGNAGIILRVSGDPKKFYLCAVSLRNGAAAARTPDTGCAGDVCAPVVMKEPLGDGGFVVAAFPLPSDVPHKIGSTIGIRASVTVGGAGDAGPTSGAFECRVFDPANPATLTSTDSKYAFTVNVGGLRWYPSGDLGLYAQRSTAVFGSIDVLRGP